MRLRLVQCSRLLVLTVLLTGWGAGEIQAQPAYLVKDINSGPSASTAFANSTHESEGAGDLFYVVLDDGIHGPEIWRSDGTPGGTRLLEDICPGACSSEPRALTASGSLLFFTADDSINGRRLWKSDGTPQGTAIVADVLPGVNSSRDSLLESDGTLYFSTYNPTDGAAIWATDGTAEGTRRVTPLPGLLGPRLLAAGDGRILVAAHGLGGWKTWITDGTEAGTRMLADVSPGFEGDPFFFTYSGRDAIAAPWGGFVFVAQEAEGPEVWITDGTPEGTSRLKDIVAGGGSFPYGFTVLNGLVLFAATDSVNGPGVWRTDGTPAGTFPLRSGSGFNPHQLTAAGGQVFFQASDPGHGAELWATNGTPAGTRLVRDIASGQAEGVLGYGFSELEDHLVFFATQNFSPVGLWESDGTLAGTRPVAPQPGGWPAPFTSVKDGFGTVGGRFFYRGGQSGLDLWAADRSSTGPVQIKAHLPMASAFLLSDGRFTRPNTFGDLNGTLLFGVWDGVLNHDLWRSDGTAAGTWEGVDLSSPTFSAGPYNLLAVNGRMLFQLDSLFAATDGTAPGTVLLPPNQVVDPVRLGEQAYFIAADDDEPGLWRTDGTPAGTVRAAELPFDYLVYPPQLTASSGKLFFRTQNPWDIWVSDGTQAGTIRLVTAGFAPAGLADGGAALFFHSQTPETGYELWKTDGTLAGTVLVKDIRPGSTGAMDSDFAYFQRYAQLSSGGVVFVADDGETGLELWKSNGSAAGTVRLLDILPGTAGSMPRHLTRIGHRIFFVANDGVHGWELWVTDGTTAGTRMLKDIAPGLDSSLPDDLEAIGDVLVFSAFDGVHGIEAWRSDGTALGTRRLQDIAPGPASSSPQQFTLSGGKVFFAANDNANGSELWAMPATALLSTFADVAFEYWAWIYIETLVQDGITQGCGEGLYCSLSHVTRAEMAIFLERALRGGDFTPPPATGTVFTDVPASHWAAAWIEQFAADGITTGCAPNQYCPDAPVSRAEMAVFLLRSKYGAAYTPPPATGTIFTDVPASFWAAAWIEKLAADGITTGCAPGQYCPEGPVSRDQMAAFLARTFGLL